MQQRLHPTTIQMLLLKERIIASAAVNSVCKSHHRTVRIFINLSPRQIENEVQSSGWLNVHSVVNSTWIPDGPFRFHSMQWWSFYLIWSGSCHEGGECLTSINVCRLHSLWRVPFLEASTGAWSYMQIPLENEQLRQKWSGWQLLDQLLRVQCARLHFGEITLVLLPMRRDVRRTMVRQSWVLCIGSHDILTAAYYGTEHHSKFWKIVVTALLWSLYSWKTFCWRHISSRDCRLTYWEFDKILHLSIEVTLWRSRLAMAHQPWRCQECLLCAMWRCATGISIAGPLPIFLRV